MARKKDLGGLAALAGLAYMASRDKGGKDETGRSALDAASNEDYKGPNPSAADSSMGDIRDEEGTLSKLRRNTETGEMYDPTGSGSSAAPSRPAASRAKPNAASTASAPKLMGDDQYNPDVKLRTSPATSRVGRAGQATVSNESMADRIAREAMQKRRARDVGTSSEAPSSSESMSDSIAREAIQKRKARESAMSGEGMKKGGSVKGWGIARGSRKAKNY